MVADCSSNNYYYYLFNPMLQDSLVHHQHSVVLRRLEAVLHSVEAVHHSEEAQHSAVVQCLVVSHSLVLRCLEQHHHSQQRHSAAVLRHSGPETGAGTVKHVNFASINFCDLSKIAKLNTCKFLELPVTTSLSA